MFMILQQDEAKEREAELMEALAECQNMVDDMQQYSYDQGRDLAAAQTQLQVPWAVPWFPGPQCEEPAAPRLL